MNRRHRLASLVLILLLRTVSAAESIDYSAMLGFNGLFRENSWTPLIIRLRNNGSSMKGELTVITDNSSTATAQLRSYSRPVDLPAGSDKSLSFVIPIGHHNRDLRLLLESEGEILIDDTVALKQRGIRGHFILVVSPYPDLTLPQSHGALENRSITYPHPDNLPRNSKAYDGVQIVSIHREYFDRLTNSQFDALSGWVSSGGVLAVWGGKSPAAETRNYLPAEITGLRRIGDSGIIMNKVKVADADRLYLKDGFEAGSRRQSGEGSVFFFPFDYSGQLRDWEGISEIWDIIHDSVPPVDIFHEEMNDTYLLEDYIRLFDNSGFTYLDRLNVALILFLSASISVSMMIFIRLRRKSENIYRYLTGFILALIILSGALFAILYNSGYRNESFAIDINIIYQYGSADNATMYKDLLIGSSSKTEGTIMLPDSTEAVLKREDNEDFRLENRPEVLVNSIKLDDWTSRTFRFEDRTESLCDLALSNQSGNATLEISNKSEFILHNSFVLHKGERYGLGNIMPESKMDFILDGTAESDAPGRNRLSDSIADLYLETFLDSDQIILCGFVTEEVNPLEFSNETWRKKTVTMVMSRLNDKGEASD